MSGWTLVQYLDLKRALRNYKCTNLHIKTKTRLDRGVRVNSSTYVTPSLLKLPCLNQYLISRARTTHQATTMGIYTQNQSALSTSLFRFQTALISIYSLQFTTTSRPIMASNLRMWMARHFPGSSSSILPLFVIYIVPRLGSRNWLSTNWWSRRCVWKKVWGRDEAWARGGEIPVPKGKERGRREGKLAFWLCTERIHNLNPVRTKCDLNPVCGWETC